MDSSNISTSNIHNNNNHKQKQNNDKDKDNKLWKLWNNEISQYKSIQIISGILLVSFYFWNLFDFDYYGGELVVE